MRGFQALILAGLLIWLCGEAISLWKPECRVVIAPSEIRPESGHAFVVSLPKAARWLVFADPPDWGHASENTLQLSEDGRALGPAHSDHQSVRELGGGRYSFWDPQASMLYFSTSDQSDPRTNARRYEAASTLSMTPSARRGFRIAAGVLALIGAFGLVVIAARREGRALARPMALATIIAAAGFATAWATRGIVSVLGAATCATAFAWIAGWTTAALVARTVESMRRAATNGALMVGSLSVLAVLGEVTLVVVAHRSTAGSPEGTAPSASGARADASIWDSVATDFDFDRHRIDEILARRDALSPEPSWERKNIADPGTKGTRWAYLYYGHPHVFGEWGVRLPAVDPPRTGAVENDRPLVLVVGDSLTWGEGVAVEERWTSVLRRYFESRRPIRVENRAACGYQSEDTLANLERSLPTLKPQVVIYGICHNDLLPSGEGHGNAVMHLPAALRSRSRLASFLDTALAGAQLRLGLAHDFYRDAVRGGQGWQERFDRDLQAMVDRIRAADAMPIAMVLDAAPSLEGQGAAITLQMEASARLAGFDVISSEPWYRRFNGVPFAVSRWEGHPNEIAHAIWGRMIAHHLAAHGPAAIRLPSADGSSAP